MSSSGGHHQAAGAGAGAQRAAPPPSRALQQLLGQALAPSTRGKYNAATAVFEQWLAEHKHPDLRQLTADPPELDRLIAEYNAHRWSANKRTGKTQARVVRDAVRNAYPAVGKLPQALAAAKAWHRDVPATAHPPMVEEVMAVVALSLAHAGHWRDAVQTVVAFHCMNRVGELVNLTRDDVVLPEDPRVQALSGQCHIRLRHTKTRDELLCAVTDRNVIDLLRLAVHGLRGHVRPFDSAYAAHFKAAVARLGLSPRYVPHSLRHGGATHRFMLGEPVDNIMITGRWAVAKTTAHYIQTGVNLLLNEKINPELIRVGRVVLPHIAWWVLDMARAHAAQRDAQRAAATTKRAVRARRVAK